MRTYVVVVSLREAFGKRGSLVRKHFLGTSTPTRVLYEYAGRGAPRCRSFTCWSDSGLEGVDTLARIQVTATRNTVPNQVPGMDVNS